MRAFSKAEKDEWIEPLELTALYQHPAAGVRVLSRIGAIRALFA